MRFSELKENKVRLSTIYYPINGDYDLNIIERFVPFDKICLRELPKSSSLALNFDAMRNKGVKLEPDDRDFPDCLNDPDEWDQYNWIDSLKISGQCCYFGIIPPTSIFYKKNNKFLPLVNIEKEKK
jgi:hypothetical protein